MRARFEKVPSSTDRSFYLMEQRLTRFDAPGISIRKSS